MKKTLLTCLLATCITAVGFSQTIWDPIQNIDPNAGDDAYVIASGDLDGDTDIDIVIGTYNFSADVVKWYENTDGDGNFSSSTTVSTVGTLSGIGGIAVVDLDGINGNDIVVSSYSNDTVMFYANNGSGFATGVALVTDADGAGQITFVDINNDTNLDLTVAAYDGNEAIWYPGNGDGTFGTKQVVASVTQPGNVSFADFDGDGDLDALVGYVDGTTQGTIEIYYNQYVESGTMTVTWLPDTVTVNSGNPFLFVAAFADVDDDGTLEIIKSDNTSGDVAYYDKIKDGASTETIIQDDSIIDRPAVVAVADFDNDTFNDVLVTDGSSGSDALIWFESTDSGGFNTEALIADHNYQVFGITIADFDADGDKDVASVGFFNGSVDWYENRFETLSVPTNQFQEISFYPNPATSTLYFRSNSIDTFKVDVYDILGKKVISSEVSMDNNALDISKLMSGLYIIKFQDIDLVYKFIKE